MSNNNNTKLSDLSSPAAVVTLNKVLDSLSNSINTLTDSSATKRVSSISTLNFGEIAANSSADTVVNILGANIGLVATANPLLTLGSIHLIWSAYVSAKNQITVKVCNPTTGPLTPNVVRWNILAH